MNNKRNQFPIVNDNEPIIQPMKEMSLYEEEDLITNIHGSYHDKNYHDTADHFESIVQLKMETKTKQSQVSKDAGQSYAQLARQAARDDVRKKRQAYFDMDKKIPSKPVFKKQLAASLPKKPNVRATNDLKELANRLRQETYILAELPRTYTEPKNEPVKSGQKNSYDFLKKSQIYNPKERQIRAERTVAQELNLTRLD